MTRVRRLNDSFDTGLVWFRRDLRNTDNAAFYYALKHCERVWCAFVFDTTILQPLVDAWQARHRDTQAQDRRIEFILAISVWRVWKRDGPSTAIVLWVVQLLFNAAWMWLFFGLHRPGLALADIVILLVLIVALTFVFWRRDRWAGILLVPYVAWVAFAAVLNYALWQLNPAV
jgi:hypothetical protein